MYISDKSLYETDVLVVGSGMIGSILALALSGVGFRVIIIDKIKIERQTIPEFDGRASAIAASSKNMLQQLGVWLDIASKATPIKEIRVVDQGSPMFLHFDSQDISTEALGFMVENRHLRKACFDKIIQDPNIVHLAPKNLISFESSTHNIKAKTEDETRINAKLIVGADGRSSRVRQLSDISLTSKYYDQTAIVFTVDHELPHYNVAYEHFLPAGPFAILPLAGKKGKKNISSIVWTEETNLAKKFLSLGNQEFKDQVTHRFGNFLGEVTPFGPRWSYPLSSQLAENTVVDRLALVGDAAHSIHPIAGQGLNLGLRDVAALCETLADAGRLGLDVGELNILEQYQKWRRFDNTTMLMLTDGFNRLFSNNLKPIKFFRGLGLATVHKNNLLKQVTMKHAMGSAGVLPRLLQGKPI